MEVPLEDLTRVIAVIPARAGSKGIIRKNFQEIEGLTLVQRAINSAGLCGEIDQIVLTTDDDQLLKEDFGIEILRHKRDRNAASDSARAADVIRDLLTNNDEIGFKETDVLVYLQPTSPFRTHQHVSEAIKLFLNSSFRPCISVKKSKEAPQKTLKLDQSNLLTTPEWEINPSGNRQSLSTYVYPNGAIYVFKVNDFTEIQDFPIVGGVPYEMSALASIDVDDEDDLFIARGLAKYAKL